MIRICMVLIIIFGSITIAYSEQMNDSSVSKKSDKEINSWKVSFLGIAGYVGFSDNKDLIKWNRELTDRYLSYIRNADSKYTNYTFGRGNNGLMARLALETRFFKSSGFGFGFNGSYIGTKSYSEINSDPAIGKSVSVDSQIDIINLGITAYYKLSFNNFLSCPCYLLVGIGMDLYYANYWTNIYCTIDDHTSSAPDGNPFHQEYNSAAVGFHGVFELGIEIFDHVPIFLQVYLPYVQFDKFSSSAGTMRFNNGSTVKPLINGFVIQIGSGYTL